MKTSLYIRNAIVPAVILFLTFAYYIPIPEAQMGPIKWSGQALVADHLSFYLFLLLFIVYGVLALAAWLVSLLGHQSQRIFPLVYVLTLFAVCIVMLLMSWDKPPAWSIWLLNVWGVLLAFLCWRVGNKEKVT